MFSAFKMRFCVSGFNPLSLTPALWLDASDANTLYDATTGGSLVAAGGAVARWEDKSGNASHATQGTGTAQPTRQTAVRNGRDIVRFDGANDLFRCDGVASVFAGNDLPISIFAVTKQDITTGLGQIISARASTSVAVHVFRNGSDFRYVRNDSVTTKFADGALANTNWNLHSVICNGTGVTIRTNGTTYASAVDVDVNTLATISQVGIGAGANLTSFFDGDIAEIFVFPTALSDTDRDNMEAYLTQKWGSF